jgi:DNA invertase Pin-like site-specific DNA recombinase
MTIKAAQYVRMSTDHQPLSIPTQKVAIAAFAEAQEIRIIRTYADEAKSGTTLSGRDGMRQLLHDVTSSDCPFTTVLVLDVSRWGRYQDVDESAYYEYHCRKHGVSVTYVAEQFKSSTSPFDSLLKQMKRMMAAEYSRELGVKSRSGQVEAVSRGFVTGMLPCLGYRRQSISVSGVPGEVLRPRERKPMITDRVRWILGPSDEVEIVRMVFCDYANGESIRSIAGRLKILDVRSHSGRPVTIEMLRLLLSSEVVTGNYSWGTRRRHRSPKTEIPRLTQPALNNHMVVPIVDLPIWELTQKRLKDASDLQRSGYRKEYLLCKMREGLAKDANLGCDTFAKYGLPHPKTFVRHFGSVTAAYAAAGRDAFDEVSVPNSIVRIGKRFTSDVFDLIRGSDALARIDRRRNLVHMHAAVFKIRIASAYLSRAGSPYWYVGHLNKCARAGNWLLVLCMNFGFNTGKEFLLMPPGEYETFRGRLSLRRLKEFDRYRIADVVELKARLVQAAHPSVDVKLTPFHGRHTVHISGVRNAQIKAAVPGGVPSTNH